MLSVFLIMSRRHPGISRLLGGMLLAAGMLNAFAAEPMHQGQTLEQWLVFLEAKPRDDAQAQQVFAEAIITMGSKVVPSLIDQLDPPLSTNQLHVASAIAACRILGPDAKSAIPALAKRLSQGLPTAAEAMYAIGPEAIPTLVKTLMEMPPSCPAQYLTVKVLGRFGAQARQGIPQLAQTLEKSEFHGVRSAAARSLGAIASELAAREPQAPEVIQAKAALVQALSTKSEWLQCDIAEALGRFKESAREAAPILSRLLHEKRRKGQLDAIYRNLEEALGTIDPQALYRGGGTSSLVSPLPSRQT